MAAALELYKESGSNKMVLSLLKNGLWSKTSNAPVDARTMPSRSFIGKILNQLSRGFIK